MDKKTLVTSAVLAVIAAVAAVILLAKPTVVVNTHPEKTNVTVQSADGSEQTFGSSSDVTTNFTAVSTTEDVGVGRNLFVAGTSTFSGLVSGVPTVRSSSMSSSATTTACTFLNNSGVSRTVTALSVINSGSASSLGSVTWQAATNTISVGVGSSATKAINATITRVAGVDVITTTSTPQLTGYVQWRSGEYLNFVSGTTTNSGSCLVQFF